MPSILERGFLANNHPDFPKTRALSIAEASIQRRRSTMAVPCGPGGVVHDYVPLYFGSVSPMLLGVINSKNVDQCDIIYFEFPIELVTEDQVVFSNASANTSAPPRFYSDPLDLSHLNWAAIDCLRWGSETDVFRHERMAEVLVHRELSVESASSVIVWNDAVKRQLQMIVDQYPQTKFPRIEFEHPYRRHYFVNFPGEPTSIVTGPRGIREAYETACASLRAPATETKFSSMRALLDALRNNFYCLSETRELVGLMSDNPVHDLTVGDHTISVVEQLRSQASLKDLPDYLQDIVELSAYLHDIGKGPMSRWAFNDGLQKVDADHPIRALPMLVKILTQSVRFQSRRHAKLLLKLVCYHDLVGDILGKGRDERQISDVCETVLELRALFALGEADARSLGFAWDSKRARGLFQRSAHALQASKV